MNRKLAEFMNATVAETQDNMIDTHIMCIML